MKNWDWEYILGTCAAVTAIIALILLSLSLMLKH
jgi:hypothetical protein